MVTETSDMTGGTESIHPWEMEPSWQLRATNLVLRFALRRLWRGEVDAARVRRRLAWMDRWLGGAKRGTSVETVRIAGVPARWVTAPGVTSDRVLLYLHGGGFGFDLPRSYERFAAELGRRLDARVLLPDYRLAPEHPFPAGPDDCLRAYRGLIESGVDPSQLVVAGDSAGGNLTLTTLASARDARLPQPAAAWAMSPGVDFNWERMDPKLAELDPVFTQDALRLMDPYVGQADRSDPRLSPLLGKAHDLAPLLLDAGEREMLREHVGWMGEHVRRCGGVAVDRVWRGAPHVFQIFSFLPEAQRSLAAGVAFLAVHLESGDASSEVAP